MAAKGKTNGIKSEEHGSYHAGLDDDDACVAKAIKILDAKLKARRVSETMYETPSAVSDYLSLKFSGEEREVFSVMYLDTRHRMIACESLFYGSVDSASVYPREIVKAALKVNAAAIILCHNHPSGLSTPSSADIAITKKIVDACAMVEIRVLDHMIVGEGKATSMASLGLM